MAEDWNAHFDREQARYEDGSARLPDDPDARQRQLTRLGNAAGGAGLALLMAGRREEAAEWFDRAARRYHESYEDAPPGSWGRPIGALKARILAGDWSGAEGEAGWALDEGAADAESPIGRYAGALALLTLGRDEDAPPGSWGRPIGALKARILAGDWSGAEGEARWALDEGAADAESPIGRYAGALALLTLGRDGDARQVAGSLRERDDFPADVADALATLAAEDTLGYTYAVESVLESFEQRDEYLEDIPVADTVVVLQALAERRGLAAELDSPLLPG